MKGSGGIWDISFMSAMVYEYGSAPPQIPGSTPDTRDKIVNRDRLQYTCICPSSLDNRRDYLVC